MSAAIEIHGLSGCPFAFRTRLVAAEKGVAFEWLPFDVPSADPRAATHNPDKRSPLLWQDGFSLIDSAIIGQYLDEAFEGPALQPTDPRERARMRSSIVELGGLKVNGRIALTDEARTVAEAALRTLDGKLGSGPWLDGETPSLADIETWPWLAVLRMKGVLGPERLSGLERASGYWERVQARKSFRENNPY